MDFPVPRGPKRKKLPRGMLKKRFTNSILRLKMELHHPLCVLRLENVSNGWFFQLWTLTLEFTGIHSTESDAKKAKMEMNASDWRHDMLIFTCL